MKRVFDLSKVAGGAFNKIAGYQVLPPLDTEQYPQRPGLEGPFRLKSGKVVYYDSREGKYYDAGADMYLSDEEYAAHDQERPNPHLPKPFSR